MGNARREMEADNDIVVLISAIEHYSYCPRQCALIHVEQTYDENVYTVRGTLAHERVHAGVETASGDVRIKRDVPLWSDRLRIRGKADLVEFRPEGPYPVEYKVGRRRGKHADLQLCAQALCLEEMLGVTVPLGAIYSHRERRRHEIEIDAELRRQTIAVIEEIRVLLRSQQLPPVLKDARCRRCSLKDACLPHVVGERARLQGLQSVLFQPWGTLQPDE
jgi:CRISPR-associated exonuclease Cas4